MSGGGRGGGGAYLTLQCRYQNDSELQWAAVRAMIH